ncbi:hypothetical protein D3C75_701900 [compost metagenome]
MTQHGGVFADTGGEHDSIHAVHGGNISADLLAHTVFIHFVCQSAALITLLHTFNNLTHVAGAAGDGLQTAVLVQHEVGFHRADAFLAHYERNDGRVDVAAAGTHHKTFQRGHTHGGIKGLATHNGCYGTAVADVGGNDFGFFQGLIQELGSHLADVEVGGAVETVAAYLVLLVQTERKRVHEDLLRHGGVESRIEYHNLRNARHIDFTCVDTHHMGRVMQRRQVEQAGDAGFDFRCHKHGLGIQVAALHHPVTDSLNLADGGNHTMLGMNQAINNLLDGHIVVQNFADFLQLRLAGRLVHQNSGVHADPFHTALGQYGLIVHIIQLVFERRATCVNYENFHRRSPSLS